MLWRILRLENNCLLLPILFIPGSSLLAEMSVWVIGNDLVTLTKGVNAVVCGESSEIWK